MQGAGHEYIMSANRIALTSINNPMYVYRGKGNVNKTRYMFKRTRSLSNASA